VPLDEHPLLSIRQCTLAELIKQLEPSKTLALSTVGALANMRDACSHLTQTERPVALIGGFAHSHFDRSTLQLADHVVSIDREGLDAWVVAARLVYEYECGLGLPDKRIRVP
jgi:rRNA pseudouridine-1189 N-methylase Emg1 (Nep1/Mra1 family)